MAAIKYSEVEEYCNRMHIIANRMKDTLGTAKRNVGSLSSEDVWSGEASNFYVTKLKKLVDSFDEVYEELESSILFMAKCSDGYEAIDKNVIKEICNNLNISEANLGNSNIYSEFN